MANVASLPCFACRKAMRTAAISFDDADGSFYVEPDIPQILNERDIAQARHLARCYSCQEYLASSGFQAAAAKQLADAPRMELRWKQGWTPVSSH